MRDGKVVLRKMYKFASSVQVINLAVICIPQWPLIIFIIYFACTYIIKEAFVVAIAISMKHWFSLFY